jgi:hypothetical protein
MSQARTNLLPKPIPNPEYILIQDENQKSHKMSIPEFEREFKMNFAQGIFYDTSNAKNKALIETIVATWSSHEMTSQARDEAVKNFINAPPHYFSLCYLNNLCGFTLVANQDIPARTVVGIYSGEIVTKPSLAGAQFALDDKIYDMSVSYNANVTVNGIAYTTSFRAKDYGDLTRFAVHLPTAVDVEMLVRNGELSPALGAKVLTVNMDYNIANINGIPVRFYETLCEIKKNQVAGINYGSGYWARRGHPSLLVCPDEKEYNKIQISQYDSNEQKYIPNEKIITINPEVPLPAPIKSDMPLEDTKTQSFSPASSPTSASFVSKPTWLNFFTRRKSANTAPYLSPASSSASLMR